VYQQDRFQYRSEKPFLKREGVAMKAKLFFGLLAFLLALGIMFADCKATPKVKYLKFGSCTAVTGPAAQFGIQHNRGREIAIDEINEAGGFTLHGQTYKWKLITKDHKYSSPEAAIQINNLIYKEKVDFLQIMGGAMIATTAPICTKAQILTLCDGNAGKEVFNPKNPLIFQNATKPSYYLVEAAYKYLVKEQKVKSAYHLGPDDETGYDVGRAAEYWGPKLGVDAKCAYYKRGTTDFYPLLTKVLGDKPGLIDVIMASPGDCLNMCKQARELDYRGPIITWCTQFDDLMEGLGPEKAENIYLYSDWGELSPKLQVFKKKYIAKWGEKGWSSIALPHYGQFYYLTDAIKKAGSLDPWKVADVLEDMVWEDVAVGKSWFVRKVGAEDYGIKRIRIYGTPFGVIKGGRRVGLGMLAPTYEFQPGDNLKGPAK
jgi:branched-chain amino acid transport system substrate-binding protein